MSVQAKWILTAALVLVTAITVGAVLLRPPLPADIHPVEQIAVDDTVREYRLVVPHQSSKPMPIVFAFHGTGDTPESMAGYSGLDRLAAKNGFLLVYPAARGSMWATTDGDLDDPDKNQDVRFVDRLLKELTNRHNIDRRRVYAVGMSNGASFAQLLATVRSEIAAVVAHSGGRTRGLFPAERGYPVMLIVGQDDPRLPAMRSDAAQYRSEGHDVLFAAIPQLGHEWSKGHNAAMWEFLSRVSLEYR